MIAAGIFRQYDVRGIVGSDLTPEVARAIGQGFATLLAARGVTGAIAVGRDNRPSGGALRDALVKEDAMAHFPESTAERFETTQHPLKLEDKALLGG